MNILLVYPEFPDTFWSFRHALKFIRKKSGAPPLGLITVAAMLPEKWNKRLIDLNVRALTNRDLKWADLVFLSAMVVQRTSAIEVIKQCNEVGVKVVAGGPLFTQEYQNFSGVATFVLNEAEITLPPFLADLEKGAAKLVYSTADFADLHQTPVPLWHLIEYNHYDSMSIQFSRGCPFNCDFCNITSLLGHVPRVKAAIQIIAELDALYAQGWRRNIFFVDDNFIGNKKILKTEILPALIEWRKGKVGCSFLTEASINLADDAVLMDLMVKAGFNNVFVGIESPDEDSLEECNKSQNKNRDLVESVKRLQRAGLQVMGGFIVGFDSDSPAIFQKQIDFIQKSGIVTAMVGLLQAPSGTRLYKKLEDEGRLTTEMSGDNTDGTTNIIPKMDRHLLQDGYRKVLNSIYSPEMFYARIKTFLREYTPASVDVPIQLQEVYAFFRSILYLGILNSGQWEYWKLFFWSLFRYPKKFPLAITFSIMGFHFRKVSQIQAL